MEFRIFTKIMSQSLISPLEKDALKECVNIGASHAATALSELTQEKISILVPNLELVSVEDVPATISKTD